MRLLSRFLPPVVPIFSLAFVLLLSAPLPGHAYGPNLLANPGFDSGLDPWENFFHLGSAVWTPSDVDGSILSGSLEFTRNNPPNGGLGVAQCVPVTGDTSYVASVSAWILAGSVGNVRAMIVGTYFDTFDCSGTGIGSFGIETATQGRWVDIASVEVTPANARSARILLINTKLQLGLDASVSIYFDNAYFGTGACAPSATQLCLNRGRFRVQAAWAVGGGGSGPGMAVPFASDSGSFWFFGANNIEMDVKVLNGCGLNSRYWVFAAGLTDVQVTLTVTDTQTGAVKVYENPLHQVYQPVTDTNAFATCP